MSRKDKWERAKQQQVEVQPTWARKRLRKLLDGVPTPTKQNKREKELRQACEAFRKFVKTMRKKR